MRHYQLSRPYIILLTYNAPYYSQASLTVHFRSSYLQKKDVERTIGIDTDYIETNDFNLEPADKLFLIEVRLYLDKVPCTHTRLFKRSVYLSSWWVFFGLNKKRPKNCSHCVTSTRRSIREISQISSVSKLFLSRSIWGLNRPSIAPTDVQNVFSCNPWFLLGVTLKQYFPVDDFLKSHQHMSRIVCSL